MSKQSGAPKPSGARCLPGRRSPITWLQAQGFDSPLLEHVSAAPAISGGNHIPGRPTY